MKWMTEGYSANWVIINVSSYVFNQGFHNKFSGNDYLTLIIKLTPSIPACKSA